MEATESLDTVLRFYESEASKNQHNPVSILLLTISSVLNDGTSHSGNDKYLSYGKWVG